MIPKFVALLGVLAITMSGSFAAEKLAVVGDYGAALAQAKKENKWVLLDFTGSDWCPPCKMMAKEVFATPEFAEFAAKNLVVMKLDFTPMDGAKPGKYQDQYNYLAQRMQVDVFPTFFLLNPSGRPVSYREGYVPGGPAGFIKWIQAVQKKAESAG